MIFKRRSPLEKELQKLNAEEEKYIASRREKQPGRLTQLLQDKVPRGLQSTLDKAFAPAFTIIFEKCTAEIDKTYIRQKTEQEYMINEYTALVKNSRKPLKNVRKNAKKAARANVALSSVSGTGLGLLGIGIPDIAVFTSLMLKSVYQTAANYGFEYESYSERRFVLTLIQAAVSKGGQLEKLNSETDSFISTGHWPDDTDIQTLIQQTSATLSAELLYIKFLQGIPVAGAAGGGYNLVYMQRVSKYAELKYRRRFLMRRAALGMPL